MARKFETPIDLRMLELLNAKAHNLSADPSGLTTSDKGLMWFNTTSGRWKYWTGTVAENKATDSDLLQGQTSAYHLVRANATGTQLAATISDFDTAVRLSRLDQLLAPNVDLSLGTHKLTNVTDGVGNQDAATVGQMNAALAGLASGQVPKGAVRVAATTNISTVTAPAVVDGVTLVNGDIVLCAGQTTAANNGPRVFTAAGAALNRAANWDTSAEAILGSYWIVQEGTNADTFALLTNDTTITLGTTALTFIFRGAGAVYTAGNGIDITGTVVSGKVVPGGYLTNGGTGIDADITKLARVLKGAIPATTGGIFSVTGASVTINHAFNNWSTDCVVRAYSTPYTGYSAGELATVNDVASDANNIVLTLPAAPAANNWYVALRG